MNSSGLKINLQSVKYRIPFSVIVFSAIGYLSGIFLIYNDPARTGSFNYYSHRLFLYFIPVAILTGFACDFALHQLNKFLPWKKFMLTRFTAGYLASILISGILILLYDLIFHRSGLIEILTGHADDAQLQILLKLVVILTFILFVYNLLNLILYSYSDFFINSLKINKMKREQMDFHIEALKNQLTPHYLFNNLNTISNLLISDKVQTDKYIRNFVGSCRFIIENSQNLLISLDKEIEFVKSYMFLMETRFRDMLKTEIDVHESIKNMYLPPLSVQMLVENAIKHNTLKTGDPLAIRIFSDDMKYLSVENNLTGNPETKNLGVRQNSLSYATF